MKSFVLVICVILIAFASAEELNKDGLRELEKQECGVFDKKDLSLNNNEVNLGSRPWMARFKILIGEGEESVCTGTLISDQFVLTAAHCVKDFNVSSVRLGEHDHSTNPDCRTYDNKKKCLPEVEDIDVEKVIIHEGFKQSIGPNDIALIKLARKVEIKEHIIPICLPVNAELYRKVKTLESMLLTGWGSEETNDDKSNILRETNLALLDRKKCSETFRGYDIETTQFCSTMNGIMCRGSSGSSLSSPVDYLGKERFVQFGILTHGVRPCTESTAVVSTNIATFMPWITRVIGEKPL